MIYWNNAKTVRLAAVALCLLTIGPSLVLAQQAPAAPGAPGAPVTAGAPQPAAQHGFILGVRPQKEAFPAGQPPRFTVTFRNVSDQDKNLSVGSYLGSQTAGNYTMRFRNLTTGTAWQPWINPNIPQPGAPMMVQRKTIKPGDTLELPFAPHTWFAEVQPDGVQSETAPHLPVGAYELTLLIDLDGIQLKPAPAPFRIVPAPEAKPLDPQQQAQLVAAAREALAKRLAQYAAGEAKSGQPGLPGGNRYSHLKPEMFTATIEPAGQGQLVKFQADLPNTEGVLTWQVGVTDQGVSPSAGMIGFVIQPRTPRAHPGPAVPRY